MHQYVLKNVNNDVKYQKESSLNRKNVLNISYGKFKLLTSDTEIQSYFFFHETLREAAKKVFFLVARPLRPYLPPPSSLVAIGTGVFFGQ